MEMGKTGEGYSPSGARTELLVDNPSFPLSPNLSSKKGREGRGRRERERDRESGQKRKRGQMDKRWRPSHGATQAQRRSNARRRREENVTLGGQDKQKETFRGGVRTGPALEACQHASMQSSQY